MSEKRGPGQPPKTGPDKTKIRTFRLTDDQYAKVRAYVRKLKAKG